MCDIFVSQYVGDEAEDGDSRFAKLRMADIQKAIALDGLIPSVQSLAKMLLQNHAVPENEVTDAFHIATAAIHGMDVLLTWNCKHLANPVTLPKTSAIITKEGYTCPVIITPVEFLERKGEFGYGR